MIKISTKYLIFIVVSTTIMASAALLVISYIPNLYDNNNNNKDRNLFSLAHAQSIINKCKYNTHCESS
jgi:hypothetical protein